MKTSQNHGERGKKRMTFRKNHKTQSRRRNECILGIPARGGSSYVTESGSTEWGSIGRGGEASSYSTEKTCRT